MPLHLRIENETSLPDGGPISYVMQSSRGGINIGRDQYLDWVLPDPTRFVSGTHCEVRFRNGQYWLHDVSTNGTFLNGSEFRLAGPHCLRSGDRVEIGRYIVFVEIEGEPNAEPSRDLASMNSQLPPDSPAVWHIPEHDAPTPIDPRELDHRRNNARAINSSSFLDWMADLPQVSTQPAPVQQPAPPPRPAQQARPAPSGEDWMQPPVAWDSPAPVRREPPPPPPASWDVEPLAPPPPPPSPVQSAPPPPLPAAFDDEPAAAAPPYDPYAAAFAQPQQAAAPAQPPPPAPAMWDQQPAAAPEPRRRQPPSPQAPMAETPAALPTAFDFHREANNLEFITRFARGARIPREAIHGMDTGDFAEMLGEFVMLTVENLRQLQLARAQFKGMIRSVNHTLVGPIDNNPLRFSPSADAAMRIMFGPRQEGYVDAIRAVEAAFTDIKRHQVDTVGAMQNAVRQALSSVSPKAVDAALPQDKGVGNLLSSRKAKLWEKYEALWRAQFGDDEEGSLHAFLRLFSQAYDAGK